MELHVLAMIGYVGFDMGSIWIELIVTETENTVAK